MKEKTLVIGGCRSGKSRHALALAEKVSGSRKIFIATCVPFDQEMAQRVERHRSERDPIWETLEVPVSLSETILDAGKSADVILVDCLTLWISNLLAEAADFQRIEERASDLSHALERTECPVVLVTNEVGNGIVPEKRLARRFRDAAGVVNQKIAAACDRVVWMVAGIPVTIKGR